MDPKIAALIDQLAVTMGVTANMLWSALVRQALISATTTAALVIFLWAVLIFGGYGIRKHWTRIVANDAEYAVVMVTAIWSLVTLIVTIGEMATIAAGFFNPNYWALRHILRLI